MFYVDFAKRVVLRFFITKNEPKSEYEMHERTDPVDLSTPHNTNRTSFADAAENEHLRAAPLGPCLHLPSPSSRALRGGLREMKSTRLQSLSAFPEPTRRWELENGPNPPPVITT